MPWFDQTLPSLHREDDVKVDLRKGVRHPIRLAQSPRVSTPKMCSTEIVPNRGIERNLTNTLGDVLVGLITPAG